MCIHIYNTSLDRLYRYPERWRKKKEGGSLKAGEGKRISLNKNFVSTVYRKQTTHTSRFACHLLLLPFQCKIYSHLLECLASVSQSGVMPSLFLGQERPEIHV